MYDAAHYPPNPHRPLCTKSGIHAADPRPRCCRCGEVGNFVANCHATVTLVDDPNSPREVYQSHLATYIAQSTTPLSPTTAPIPEPQQQLQQQSQYHKPQHEPQLQQQPQQQPQYQQQHQHQSQLQQQSSTSNLSSSTRSSSNSSSSGSRSSSSYRSTSMSNSSTTSIHSSRPSRSRSHSSHRSSTRLLKSHHIYSQHSLLWLVNMVFWKGGLIIESQMMWRQRTWPPARTTYIASLPPTQSEDIYK